MTGQQAQVTAALRACRMAQLGGHIYQGNECDTLQISSNPCREQHCSQWKKFRKAQWIEKQTVERLPTPYFHFPLTTDHVIKPLIPANQIVIYDALRLMEAVRETLKRFGQKYLGKRQHHLPNNYSFGHAVFYQFSTANWKGVKRPHKNHN